MAAIDQPDLKVQEQARARDLVGTSVQDMQSGLWAFKNDSDLRVLLAALKICRRRKEKTKAQILMRKIKHLSAALGLDKAPARGTP